MFIHQHLSPTSHIIQSQVRHTSNTLHKPPHVPLTIHFPQRNFLTQLLSLPTNRIHRWLLYWTAYRLPPTVYRLPPPIQDQSSTALVSRAAASAVVLAINNSVDSPFWTNLPTISILARVQPLLVSFGTNTPTNNSAELLARNLSLEMVPPPHTHYNCLWLRCCSQSLPISPLWQPNTTLPYTLHSTQH